MLSHILPPAPKPHCSGSCLLHDIAIARVAQGQSESWSWRPPQLVPEVAQRSKLDETWCSRLGSLRGSQVGGWGVRLSAGRWACQALGQSNGRADGRMGGRAVGRSRSAGQLGGRSLGRSVGRAELQIGSRSELPPEVGAWCSPVASELAAADAFKRHPRQHPGGKHQSSSKSESRSPMSGHNIERPPLWTSGDVASGRSGFGLNLAKFGLGSTSVV